MIDENTPLSDLSLPEISELIEEVSEDYYNSNDPDERKRLRNEYITMVKYYNEASGIKAYKLSL